jgi:CrcB protein
VMSSLVITGILGGYTTFSSMQLDAVQMAEGRRHALALFYLVSSVLTGLIAAAAGVALAKA